jgi:hypothetical protein
MKWYCGRPIKQLDPKIAVKAANALVVSSEPKDNNEPTSAIKK